MNLLPRRRSSRPRGRARLAPVADRDDTQWLSQITTGPADGTTWPAPDGGQSVVIFAGASDFEGANEIGLMPAGVVAIKEWGRDTQPLARLRTQPEVTS